jgi:hypothetical protein
MLHQRGSPTFVASVRPSGTSRRRWGGRRALICGVRARGVIVSFAPNEPLITIGSVGVELL